MNVLLTCAGRRNYLLEYFRAALDGRGQVFATDSSIDAPALHEADRGFVVPPISRPEYIEHMLRLCREHEVALLVSLNDLELPLLARHRERFRAQGTTAVISSPEVVDICYDKWATCRFLERCGVTCPKSYLTLEATRAALDQGDVALPLVVKPRWGSASTGILVVDCADDLAPTCRLVGRQAARPLPARASAGDAEHAILIQELIIGREYGRDIVNDLDGRHVATFARCKLAMRAGETDRAVTVDREELHRLGAAIGGQLGHVGNLDCDVLAAQDRMYVLDLNPRFGGGYPFSHAAGANLPAALLAWACNEAPDPSWLEARPNVRVGKCDRLVVVPSAGSAPGSR